MNIKFAKRLRQACAFTLQAAHQSNQDLVKALERIHKARAVVETFAPMVAPRVRGRASALLKQGFLYRAATVLMDGVPKVANKSSWTKSELAARRGVGQSKRPDDTIAVKEPSAP